MENEAPVPQGKRDRSLRASIWDASLYASMVGFGETYFIPLILFLGASSFQVGLFTALPQLGIAFSQFFSIYLVERLRVRKRIVISGASGQFVVIGLIFGLLLAERIAPWLFIALTVVYFTSNAVVGPAWNSLIGDLTAPENRGDYFGRRNGLSQLISFAAILAGGTLLHYFSGRGEVKLGFAAILLAAGLSRLGSIHFLTRHFEVPYRSVPDAQFSFWQFVRRSPKSNFAHFVFFVALMSLSVQIAAPFFPVYMLRDLGFSYMQFTIAQGLFIATQFIAMKRWGSFADEFGNRRILRITGALMPIAPLLWLLSRDYYYILAIQVLAGIAWAGWSLSTANFIFDAVTPPKRARCAAYLNFFNSFGVFAGALIGAFLSARAPHSIDTGAVKLIFFSPLEFLFLLSSVLRLAAVFMFIPSIHEVREVRDGTSRDMFMTFAHVPPLSGVRFWPFTGVDAKNKQEAESRE